MGQVEAYECSGRDCDHGLLREPRVAFEVVQLYTSDWSHNGDIVNDCNTYTVAFDEDHGEEDGIRIIDLADVEAVIIVNGTVHCFQVRHNDGNLIKVERNGLHWKDWWDDIADFLTYNLYLDHGDGSEEDEHDTVTAE